MTVDGLGLALTTDTYVVRPLRFPGGSIGELAVNGTVNDLAAAGRAAARDQRSRWCSRRASRPTSCAPRSRRSPRPPRAAGVEVVTGDTKVVERGHADGMYVTTTGIGARRPARLALAGGARARRPGARLADDRRARHRDHARPRRARARRRGRVRHPLAVAGRRGAARRRRRRRCAAMRDATRGGVATVLNELARASGVGDLGPRGRRSRCAPRSPAPASCSGSTRCTSPTRA